jgi:lantibiotic modifying enzyme
MNHSFLELADRIGARICRDAIWDGGRCNWVAGRGKGGKDCEALTPSLYSGTSGIALFLYRLSDATGEKIFRDTADAALRQALSQTDRLLARGDFGLYTGLGGVAYIARDTGLAERTLNSPAGKNYDLIAGAAGMLVTALNLSLIESATRQGEILLDAARRSDAGWSWPTIVQEAKPGRPDLLGFGHGAAGIAWALLELWHATSEQRYRTAAEEGFRYEQSWFSVEHGNWPDLRQRASDNTAAEYSLMWCHGAAGIAFSRLRAAQLTGELQYQEQAGIALRAVERELQNQGSCCICHGLFGSIDLLLYANRIALAESAARDAIDRYPAQRLPWPCGIPEGHETPDLMLGLAGIGHTLLRLDNPSAFPSPLMILGLRPLVLAEKGGGSVSCRFADPRASLIKWSV